MKLSESLKAHHHAAKLKPAEEDEILTSLLVRSGRGDMVAFEQFYAITSGRIFGLVLRLITRRQDGEDILREIYVFVWLHSGDYDPLCGRPIAWLGRLSRDRVIARIRMRISAIAPASAEH